MSNADILEPLELTAKLLELHAENDFKVRSYQNAVFSLDKTTADLATLSVPELAQLPGVGKSLAGKIDEIRRTGTLGELAELLARTPEGVLDMFRIKGIGPKKIRLIWLELGITDLNELLLACEKGDVAKLKGFGEKIQDTIARNLRFMQANTRKLRLDQAEAVAQPLYDELQKHFNPVEIVGDLRRKNEVVDTVQILVATHDPMAVQRVINALPFVQQEERASSPFVWRGTVADQAIPVEIRTATPAQFTGHLLLRSAAAAHLAKAGSGGTLMQAALAGPHDSEEAIYQRVGLPYVVPEMREGGGEFDWAAQHQPDELVTWEALKGILHNHSTYSDGKHTLEQMAKGCRDLGFEYLGMADHSQSATYAQGLHEDAVFKQQAEIDKLNAELKPFRIFKGIESDILGDGSLDYPEHVLKTFDYVVASVHSNLTMNEEKAMERLVRAIENPYTTILGHATGRLLLIREGYPIDHRKIIDACAANGIIIELNADPHRLDMDWRWIPYALEKEVMIALNPDAHSTGGYLNMHYGAAVARKGGLTTAMTFNALGRDEISAYFAKRRGR
ncbi:MAG: PHP domain-containing protein [Cytophagaceae bacterium]|nr:PHP domain-containing protein [Cytophagaceae bacterium]